MPLQEKNMCSFQFKDTKSGIVEVGVLYLIMQPLFS